MRVETLRLNYYQSTWQYIDINFDDNDYIQDSKVMYLNFELSYYIEFHRGAYIDYKVKNTDTPVRYYLLGNSQPKKINSENFKFSLTLYTEEGKLSDWILKNTIDNRIKFSLTARPQEFLQLIVDNANLRESGWTVGNYITATEKVCSFSSNNLTDALQLIADAFETEWYVIGKTIYLNKREFNYANPLTLQYGSGYGIKPTIERKDYNRKRKINKLWVQGGDKNLNTSSSSYGNKYLLLPKGQSIWYNGIDFVSTPGTGDARLFTTDVKGLYIYRAGDNVEGTYDASNIYPKRVGTISSFDTTPNSADANNPFYNIYDTSIPAALDYNDYLLAGETMTVIFQSGRLAGKTFDVSYIHSSRCFQLVSYSEDGQTYPNSVFTPAIGDTYAVFGCTLPDAYICDNVSKTGASWDMFKEAVKYMWDEEVMQCIFTLPIDEIWLRSTGNEINIGDFINFVDSELAPGGLKIRVTNLKRNLRNPYKIEITLSNVRVGGGLLNRFNRFENLDVLNHDRNEDTSSSFRRDISSTQRRIADKNKNWTTKPVPTYYEGDQWLVAPADAITGVFVAGDIVSCLTTRETGVFTNSDWTLSRYKGLNEINSLLDLRRKAINTKNKRLTTLVDEKNASLLSFFANSKQKPISVAPKIELDGSKLLLTEQQVIFDYDKTTSFQLDPQEVDLDTTDIQYIYAVCDTDTYNGTI
ncbi:MAG: hypothetical protein PHG18_04420, partial [Bacilli bacterium]|nr:hypothetical protein [Bacilli bacterium]